MIRRSLAFAVFVAFALALAPPAIASDTTTAAPFSVELLGADADSWVDRFSVRSTCNLNSCLFQCNVSRNICFSSGTGFAVCMLLYEYCIDDCYTNCT